MSPKEAYLVISRYIAGTYPSRGNGKTVMVDALRTIYDLVLSCSDDSDTGENPESEEKDDLTQAERERFWEGK